MKGISLGMSHGVTLHDQGGRTCNDKALQPGGDSSAQAEHCLAEDVGACQACPHACSHHVAQACIIDLRMFP